MLCKVSIKTLPPKSFEVVKIWLDAWKGNAMAFACSSFPEKMTDDGTIDEVDRGSHATDIYFSYIQGVWLS